VKIINAWFVAEYPNEFIIESAEHKLFLVKIAPYRQITENDLIPYHGYHPKKLKGVSLHKPLYEFYGLEKDIEKATETLYIKVTLSEKNAISEKADAEGKRLTEYLRNVIWDIIYE